ncbi:hypothetical protein LJR289_000393 [Pseudoduganella sp. LjRoot289]|uniref:hypothetical protein n=1 Tax=Pseudoduganella sp. LjRoot289 TaxID=3342314 RepID=UPI003ECD4A31
MLTGIGIAAEFVVGERHGPAGFFQVIENKGVFSVALWRQAGAGVHRRWDAADSEPQLAQAASVFKITPVDAR